jgi:hypothetical protein
MGGASVGQNTVFQTLYADKYTWSAMPKWLESNKGFYHLQPNWEVPLRVPTITICIG